MQAGIARISGRTILALLTAVAMVISVVVLLAEPASADGQGSPQECEFHAPGLTWPTYTIGNPNEDDSVVLDADNPPAPIWGSGWVVWYVCIKSGSQQFGGNQHSEAFFADGIFDDGCYEIDGIGTRKVTVTNVGDCQAISHIDVAKQLRDPGTTTTTVPDDTTTTTVPETTTTTIPDETTTTVEETTTTTVEVIDTTVTTQPEETTTTSIEDEVLDTSVTTQPEETTTSIEDEVLAEELPFTGMENTGLAIIAAVLASLGLLVTLSARRIEE